MAAIGNQSGKLERVKHIPGDSCLSGDDNEKKRRHREQALNSYYKRKAEKAAEACQKLIAEMKAAGIPRVGWGESD